MNREYIIRSPLQIFVLILFKVVSKVANFILPRTLSLSLNRAQTRTHTESLPTLFI